MVFCIICNKIRSVLTTTPINTRHGVDGVAGRKPAPKQQELVRHRMAPPYLDYPWLHDSQSCPLRELGRLSELRLNSTKTLLTCSMFFSTTVQIYFLYWKSLIWHSLSWRPLKCRPILSILIDRAMPSDMTLQSDTNMDFKISSASYASNSC